MMTTIEGICLLIVVIACLVYMMLAYYGDVKRAGMLQEQYDDEIKRVVKCKTIVPEGVCACCDETCEGRLCESCETYINSLNYCETHEHLFEGIDCPECKYGVFAQKK